MAERIDIETGEVAPQRRRYPWKDWEAQPYAQWVLSPGEDFDVLPLVMVQIVKTRAKQMKVKVNVSRKDTYHAGRVAFRFYKEGEHKPVLYWAAPSISLTIDASQFDSITCAICGSPRPVTPDIAHILECIEWGGDPKDINWYALHRPDPSNARGLRRLDALRLDELRWSLEEGPVLD